MTNLREVAVASTEKQSSESIELKTVEPFDDRRHLSKIWPIGMIDKDESESNDQCRSGGIHFVALPLFR